MSNKIQLQTNNTKYASLIETLRGKSVGGEDVTAETTAYTTKLASLETAVAALESELEGKASGGSGGSDTDIETYSLILQSDGIVIPSFISYISYVNKEYQYHIDNISNLSYPATFTNVVLKAPVGYGYNGGLAPWVSVSSNIDCIFPKDYIYTSQPLLTDGIFPLNSDNGQIIIRFYDDD